MPSGRVKTLNLTGQRFGFLTVTEEGERLNNRRSWLCVCDCGATKLIVDTSLLRGVSRSCGHLRRDLLVAKLTTHGLTNTPGYTSWAEMMARCNNPESPSYKNYGSRGIKVCARWSDVRAFMEDMGERPEGHSIERLDVNGEYTPENCIWATHKTQVRNRRVTTFVTYQGVTKPLAVWAEEFQVRLATLRIYLFDKGISIADALPIIRRRRKLPYKPEVYS